MNEWEKLHPIMIRRMQDKTEAPEEENAKII